MNSHTVLVDKNKVPQLKNTLIEKGLSKVGNKTPYEEFRYKGNDVNAVYYKSGKLLIQGKGADRLCGQLFEDDPDQYIPRIGSDEVGKGDYFGPMVVAACFLDKADIKEIKSLGVTDSKNLSDNKICEIAEVISTFVDYEVKVIDPIAYDREIEEYKNASIVLGKGHSDVLNKLLERVIKEGHKPEKIVVDQFSKSKSRLLDLLDDKVKRIKIEQKHHGESDLAVAAASIIARWVFLDEWHKMEERYSFKFPKGASEVIGQARVFVDQYGTKELDKVAKKSFKTTEKVLENKLLL